MRPHCGKSVVAGAQGTIAHGVACSALDPVGLESAHSVAVLVASEVTVVEEGEVDDDLVLFVGQLEGGDLPRIPPHDRPVYLDRREDHVAFVDLLRQALRAEAVKPVVPCEVKKPVGADTLRVGFENGRLQSVIGAEGDDFFGVGVEAGETTVARKPEASAGILEDPEKRVGGKPRTGPVTVNFSVRGIESEKT